jgi:hypothetical protein
MPVFKEVGDIFSARSNYTFGLVYHIVYHIFYLFEKIQIKKIVYSIWLRFIWDTLCRSGVTSSFAGWNSVKPDG